MDVHLDNEIVNLLLENPYSGSTTQFDRFFHATLTHNQEEFTIA
jgi:hypothetical protein